VSVRIAHSVPGRLRIRYPPHWLRPRQAAIQDALSRLPGVRSVSARGVTGSVLVEYDAARTAEPAVVAALTALGSHRPVDEPASRATSRGTTLGSAVPGASPLVPFLTATGMFAASFLPVPGPIMSGFALASGWPLLARAGRALARGGRPNVEMLDAATLILLAVRGNYRAAALLLWLLSAGQYVLDSTVVRIRRSIRDLLASPVDLVWREADGGRTQIPIGAVRAGDTLVVAAGDRVPVDGIVVHGEALVDQQWVTGESLPVERVPGDRVYASTMVEDGEVAVRVDRVGIDTSVGRIIEAIEAAEGEKPELQLFAEELADRLVLPTVGMAALATGVTRNLDAGIAILVADYGTPVRVAIPTVAMVARIRASGAGILVKGPGVLERLARVDTVVFDKTGTLTLGTPRVNRVVSYGAGLDEDEVVRLAAAAERGFRHPVARAVMRLAAERRLPVPRRTQTELRLGLGIGVRVDGRQVLVGSRRFMESHGIPLDRAADDEAASHRAGGAPTFVAIDGRLGGLLLLQDELRSEAQDAVLALRARRMRNVIMVSGDHAEPTRVIAESLGVRHYYPDLLPEEKAELIERFRAEGRVVAMVGDGVNDALALNRADVGIAVPGGAEVVAEAAGVVLLRGGLDKVVLGIDVARESMVQFKRVVDVAVHANLVVIGLASVGLAGPVTSILLSNGAAVGAALYSLLTPPAAVPGLGPGSGRSR
jgi:Cu2+-exporting ATPase